MEKYNSIVTFFPISFVYVNTTIIIRKKKRCNWWESVYLINNNDYQTPQSWVAHEDKARKFIRKNLCVGKTFLLFFNLMIKTYDRQKWLSYPAGLVAHNCLWALTMIYQPFMLPQIRMTIELGAKLTAHNYLWFHICYKYSTNHFMLYNTSKIPP